MKPSRNTSESICLVLNPRAGGGRAATRLDELRRAADRAFQEWELRLTEGPGHAVVLAQEAAARGRGIVAAVGGDGTCHEVVTGLLQPRPSLASEPVFTNIPLGTGGDLRRSLEIPERLDEAMWMASMGSTRRVDVGHARWEADQGLHEEPFINVAGVGANGEVVASANGMAKRALGRATFVAATVAALTRYEPPPVVLTWTGPDGGVERWEGPLLALFLANGAWCGGGMWVGRGGSMHDGLLDVTVVKPGAVLTRVGQLPRLYDGSLERVPGVFQVKASEVEVMSSSPFRLPLDLDGESRSGRALRVSVRAGALAVRDGRSPAGVDVG